MLADFEDIADDLGITIPEVLGQLIELGSRPNHSGAAVPLSSIYDFEFIDAGDVERMLSEWLGRKKQRAAAFTLLPFGQTGAGDAFCFVEFDEGDQGIALVLHDEESSILEFSSVSHWVTDLYVKACVNLQDLVSGPAAGVERMKAEVDTLSSILLPEHQELLERLLSSDIVERPYRTGPKAALRMVPTLLAQDAAEALYQSLASENSIEFEVIPEWED